MSYFYENIDLYRDYLLLTEAYIGKTPILQEVEQKIGIARKKVKYYGSNNNTIPEILEINRLMEKQFGMDLFGLKIYTSDYPNAYTTIIAINFDIAKNYVMHNMITADSTNGYRFKKDNGFLIEMYMSSAMLLDDRYTDGELVAVMLHEIGHNFADCIYDKIEIANNRDILLYQKILIAQIIFYAITVIGIPEALSKLKLYISLHNAYKYKKEKKAQKSKRGFLSGLINGAKAKAEGVYGLVNEILARLTGGASLKSYKRNAKMYKVDDEVRSSIGRQNEVFADKFAGVYGYGPEQASVLTKFSKLPSKAADIISKWGGFFKDLSDKFDEELLDINDFDVHPQVMQRINAEINLLKNELKKEDLDPKIKAAIQKQLDELAEIVENNLKITKEMSKSEKALALYNQMIMNDCPDAIEKELEDAIEAALDAALEKKE